MNRHLGAITDQSREERRQLLARLIDRQAAAKKLAPLSFAQQRLWFLDQLTKVPSLYNMANSWPLSFPVDVDVFKRCLMEIVRRHEVLRTTFGAVDGSLAQTIASSGVVELFVTDLSGKTPEARDEEAGRIAAAEYEASFDLRTGPLLRTKLLRYGANDYVFLLTMHHIVSDGWSLGIFFRELAALYAAYSTGQNSPLPEPPIQYADFAIWQRNYLTGEVREQELNYWRKQLAALTVLELPADRPRAPTPSFRGTSVPVRLPTSVLPALRALAHEGNATLFMVLLAAFKVLLYRYSGQEDVIVGSPIAGRNRRETEGLIGFFVNPLVMRTNLGGDPTFRELLDRVRETALGAYAHQDLPFEMLVEEMHPDRDLGRNPLFQVIFQLLNGPDASVSETNGRPHAPVVRTATSKFDLTLTLYESPESITGWMEYASDVFDEDRIVRMTGHYAALLESIAAEPGRCISQLNLLTAAERSRILGEWIATAAPFPVEHGALEAFERNAAARPEAPALLFKGAVMSYGELDLQAERLAGQLQVKGAGRGAVVGIQLPRSPDMVVAAVAVLKTGAAYLPIDPDIPPERREAILRESRAVALVTADLLPPADTATVKQKIEYDQDALAYVIFTSGSTGKPKGVQISHRGLSNLIAWHNRTFDVVPSSRATQFAGPGFDAAVWETWPYLAAGASIEIVPDEIRYAAARLPQWISERGITHCFVPTPLIETLMCQVWPAPCSLRFLLTGGDKLLRGVPPGLPFRVFNQYGPTENTVVTTSGPVPEENGKIPSIGRPIDNVELFVVDPNGQSLPAGIAGELWIGGAGLARGYLHAPGETAERFVAHPVRPGEKVYRSGDLVRYTRCGEIEFLGRIDRQVKIRGFRVEPGEIEAVLARAPGVQNVCVAVLDDVPGDEHLVAYVTGEPDVAQIRAYASEKLPSYMLPSAIVVLDSFPLTVNGKVDRARLPAPVRGAGPAACVPPRTETEEMLCAIWCEELHLERVGIDENFFDIGGNSLALVRIHLRLEAKLHDEIPVVELFRFPTIRSLAAFLNERGAGQSIVEKARERAAKRRERRA